MFFFYIVIGVFIIVNLIGNLLIYLLFIDGNFCLDCVIVRSVVLIFIIVFLLLIWIGNGFFEFFGIS